MGFLWPEAQGVATVAMASALSKYAQPVAATQVRAQMRKTVVDLVLATDMKQVRIERIKDR